MAYLFGNILSRASGLKNVMISAKRMVSSEISPTPRQKKVLVFTKFYPDIESVPKTITRERMRKASDIFRVRVSIIMMGVALLSALVVGLYGRYLRDKGDSYRVRGLHMLDEWKQKAEDKQKAEEKKK